MHNLNNNQTEFLKSAEAAEFLHISIPTLHAMRKAGTLRSVPIGDTGRKFIFIKSQLIEDMQNIANNLSA